MVETPQIVAEPRFHCHLYRTKVQSLPHLEPHILYPNSPNQKLRTVTAAAQTATAKCALGSGMLKEKALKLP